MRAAVLTISILLSSGIVGREARATETWRYYRPGNTGIQGDYNEALWVAPDGDPWIAGYSPVAEEGGIAKFLQAENRWINVSNIDYPVIGSANEPGVTHVTDMVADTQGNLWIGTLRGVLRMNLAVGPSSLVRFGPGNSALPGGGTADISLAPDGSIWISAYSTVWGGGGLTRFDPGTGQWSHINGHGGSRIAAQPRPGGGYYIWSDLDGYDGMERYDSVTHAWTVYTFGVGKPASLPSINTVDDAGNVWMTRWLSVQGDEVLDCIRPNGTWVSPPLPPRHPQVPYASLRAYGNMGAYLVTGFAHLFQFQGSSWTDLGAEPYSGWIQTIDFDSAGNIWMCGVGTGGVFRRDVETGVWQRYRVTNTSNFDFFNNDLSVDPNSGDVYACANANPDIGGMVKFDGVRWTGFVNQDGYGLTEPWPWPGAPQSEAVLVRPSNGHVVANPINQFSHEFDGAAWTALTGGSDQMSQYVEDSLGRLWGIGHYGGLGIFDNGNYTLVPGGGWGASLRVDPDRPGTIWCNGAGTEVRRTDGSYNFTFTPNMMPGVTGFNGLAPDHNGICWVGAQTTQGAALIRIDANTGHHDIWRSNAPGWPFTATELIPLAVTPDGRVWMAYNNGYPFLNAGLLWWNGTQVGVYQAPPNGEWQWGGLPHYIIQDLEVKLVPGGYELWMSCMSRGIAVLKVVNESTDVAGGDGFMPRLQLAQNEPNPFRLDTRIDFSLPRTESVRLEVFDAAGRVVRRLVNETMPAGSHRSMWDGRDDNGNILPSGVYHYRLSNGGESTVRKLVRVR
ncbi:MAG: FlgD immunoglobulin-like domain containing protein [Candidatus Eisenbacteria bacterium]